MIKQIMRLQLQLCVTGKLSDELVIKESKLKSNMGSSTEKTFIAYELGEAVGFCVIGVKEFGTIDPYDPFCHGGILRILARPERRIYHNLFDVGEKYLTKRNASTCSIIVVNDGSRTENLCRSVAEHRDYETTGLEPSRKLLGKSISPLKKELKQSETRYLLELIERTDGKERPIRKEYSNERRVDEKIETYMELRKSYDKQAFRQELDRVPLYLFRLTKI